MKNSLIIIFIFFNLNPIFCQIPKKGDYLKNTSLDKYIGTWEATSDNETLKIILKKEKILIKGLDFYQDILIGWHIFIKNGKVIESSIEFEGGGYDSHVTILASSNDDNTLKITTFHDLSRKRNNEGFIKLKNSNEAVLSLVFSEKISINEAIHDSVDKIPMPLKWNINKIK